MIPFTATADLSSKVRSVMGWHVAEDAGTPAAATVKLRNGSASGAVIAQIELAASGSEHFAATRPMLFSEGLYVEVVVGTVAGSIQPG